MTVAIVHDYLTQRGGAERVVLSMLDAFPEAPVHTTLFAPELTFSEFERASVRPSALDRVGLLRRHHRLALPFLAPVVSRMEVDADVVLCSSSGWAHGVEASGRKVVYCHAPARWLYQTDRYTSRLHPAARVAALALRRPLARWDGRRARTAARYLANSTHVARLVRDLYGIDAEVLPPPPVVTPGGEAEPVEGVEPGFLLCVSRLLPYKNVDAVVDAFAGLPGERLVVVGGGPDEPRLRARAPANVEFVGVVSDAALRWLYGNAAGLVAASYEDFGLTPLEAASFGTPTAALRFGGFLDTLVEGRTGVFFDAAEPDAVAAAVERLLGASWSGDELEENARRFSQERFAERLRAIVDEEAEVLRPAA